jgi:NAD+ synthase (glutamine-hydrolysing)
LQIALAQFNASVGDIKGNVRKMQTLGIKAFELGADIVVFPEMSVCGYPPEDLLFKEQFLKDNRLAVEHLAKNCPDITIVAGFAEINEKGYYNSLVVLQKGQIKKIYHKSVLPNYGVFDERRYFRPGTEAVCMNIGGLVVAFTICEDIWRLKWMDNLFEKVPPINIIINISASPFHIGKIEQRQEILSQCAKHFNCVVAYCNLVGGQDELVFDGRSMFVDSSGRIVCQAKAFEEDMLMADFSAVNSNSAIRVKSLKNYEVCASGAPVDSTAEVYNALILGTKDYVQKNNFSKVIIGLSGGIDSSLTAAIAVDALGAKNVVGVTMPSKFNNPETIRDAQIVADNLDIEFHIVPIEAVLEAFNGLICKFDKWTTDGVAYENLQARVRGCILMALSNQYSYLVLATSNKSEAAVGYSTLYGDTAGGLAVLKDVSKTMVYQLAEYINNIHHLRSGTPYGGKIIPLSVIKRPPSAELKENQKDTDSLPPYDLLDRILKDYVEEDKSATQLIGEGLPKDVVSQILSMVDRSEYKRRQSPPGIKIAPKSFGKDRRMPITNLYH